MGNCHVTHLPLHCAEMSRGTDKLIILLRCLAASGTGAAGRTAAAVSAGYGPPVYKEESATPDATVFYLLDQTYRLPEEQEGVGSDCASGQYPHMQDQERQVEGFPRQPTV